MVITFNYKDGSETVSLSEIENSDLSSDLTASALPNKKVSALRGDFFVSRNKDDPEARGACRATPASAAGGGYSEQGLAQRSKKSRRGGSPKIFSGTARGGAKPIEPFCP